MKVFVFQSTRPRGARRIFACWISRITTFQSTRPRGARRQYNSRRRIFREFQSTRPRGARRLSVHLIHRPLEFQSTRPRGARPQDRIPHRRYQDFNPRARVGRDCACLHGLNYSGCAIFFANLIFGRAVTGIFRRKVLCVIRVRTEILRPFSRRRCLLQHQSSFGLVTWFCTDVLRFSCVFIARELSSQVQRF